MTAQPQRQGMSLFGPILLIGAGILFLLNNMGVIDVDLFALLARFWPLLLIAAGIDLLLGRRSGMGATLALLALAFLLLMIWRPAFWSGVAGGQETQAVAQALGDVEQAEVRIEPNINSLRLQSTPDRDVLVEGQVAHSRSQRIVEEQHERGGTAYYTLRAERNTSFVPIGVGGSDNDWELRLNSQVPIALYVNTGVGSAELDLENIRLTLLDLTTGVGSAEITLPGRGEFDVAVEAGVGSITLRVPDSLAVRIHAEAGLGSVNVPGSFSESDNVYLSPDFDSAQHRAEITLQGGVGSIDVVQVAQR